MNANIYRYPLKYVACNICFFLLTLRMLGKYCVRFLMFLRKYGKLKKLFHQNLKTTKKIYIWISLLVIHVVFGNVLWSKCRFLVYRFQCGETDNESRQKSSYTITKILSHFVLGQKLDKPTALFCHRLTSLLSLIPPIETIFRTQCIGINRPNSLNYLKNEWFQLMGTVSF